MSMPGYTKLFNSILASTIWRAPNTTRIVWITMLAMADKDGVVEGSVPGLADFARVSIKEAESALEELLAPDPYSRTAEHEGRRIEALDGTGWRLLNHSKYRAKMSEDERREYNRKKQAEWRGRKKPSKNVNDSQLQSPTVNDSSDKSAMSAQAEADSKAEAIERKKTRKELAEWIERIRTAYPRNDSWQDCAHAIRTAIDAGHQTPEQILADVKSCAAWIREAESNGKTCAWVPKARTFFNERQWTEPKNFEATAIKAKEATHGTKTHIRASGELNEPGRYD